jgi:mRNA interferase MazF
MNDNSNKKYIKRYDEWSKIKKTLNEKTFPNSFFFLEREIWWASIGVNVGNEIDGKNENFERPVLIIKKFNETDFIGLPLSTKKNTREIYHPIIYRNELNYAYLKQTRYYSVQRLLRLIRRMDEAEFILIRDKIVAIFL